MKNSLARVVKNEKVFGDYHIMEVGAPGIGKKAAPGQFFMLKVGLGTDPLLRRPFCLHRVVSEDSVRFLYKVVGRGTRLLPHLVPGDEVEVLGPLGRGFVVGRGVSHALIVSGGYGVASTLALAEYLVKERRDVTVACFIGGRTKADILGIGEFRKLGVKTYVTTEDGSLPRKGLVTDSLDEYITKYARHGTKGWEVYSCGPKPMLISVAAVAERFGLKNYASLEANMACGVGACMGCVVSVLDEEHGTGVYRKVCEDGPVFDAQKVLW